MGAKSSKSASGALKSPKSPPSALLRYPDLDSFVFLGGLVVSPPSVSFPAPPSPKFTPPAPASSPMTPAEQEEHARKVEKAKQRYDMERMMEKNLKDKSKQGHKPKQPPQPTGVMAKAKKKMVEAQEKMKAAANEPPKESVKDRVQRQAMNAASGALTGGATAALGQEIAKSEAMRDLEKKRKEFAKAEEARKKTEEAQKKKAVLEKEKNKPKGLADFLEKTEGAAAAATAAIPAAKEELAPAKKMQAFLSSVETGDGGGAAMTTLSEPAAEGEKPKNKLAAFLSTAPAAVEQINASEQQSSGGASKLSSFVESTTRRLSFKKRASVTAPVAEEEPKPAREEGNSAVEFDEPAATEEAPSASVEVASPSVQEAAPADEAVTLSEETPPPETE